MGDGYHFTMSLGRELFSQLLSAALPVEIKSGSIELIESFRGAARQMQIKQKVYGLLEDRESDRMSRLKDKVDGLWTEHREDIFRLVQELVRVDGDWKIELDRQGSDLMYGPQKVGAEATVRFAAEGKVTLLKKNLELPFQLEKRLGAQAWLGRIRYDAGSETIVANVQDVGLHLGENPLLQLLQDMGFQFVEQYIEKMDAIPLLPKGQFNEMLAPVSESPLKLKMSITEMRLDVDEDDISLKVKFGFSQLQLEDKTS